MDDLIAALNEKGVPVAPVNDMARAFRNPQLQERGMIVEVNHPLAGPIRLVGNPVRYSETPVTRYEAPPTIGQHNEEVLSGLLSMTSAQIEELRTRGVI
jgi:crotonobetainyl-CoA:carnitine CoA-transferase CaiB-like acyl-CoA transferase